MSRQETTEQQAATLLQVYRQDWVAAYASMRIAERDQPKAIAGWQAIVIEKRAAYDAAIKMFEAVFGPTATVGQQDRYYLEEKQGHKHIICQTCAEVTGNIYGSRLKLRGPLINTNIEVRCARCEGRIGVAG